MRLHHPVQNKPDNSLMGVYMYHYSRRNGIHPYEGHNSFMGVHACVYYYFTEKTGGDVIFAKFDAVAVTDERSAAAAAAGVDTCAI